MQWNKTPEDTRAALVAQYRQGQRRRVRTRPVSFLPTPTPRFTSLTPPFAPIRKERGELGEDHSLPTREGAQDFATGDRIQFTGNAAKRAQKDAGLYNGAAGRRRRRSTRTALTVTLDSAKEAPPRVVSFTVGANAEAGEFDAIRHGYAGTIYKGQGKTLDQTYLLHSDNWRAATGYVALSRHRESVKLFAAEKAEPWIMAEGGAANLTETQRAKRRAELCRMGGGEARPCQEIRLRQLCVLCASAMGRPEGLAPPRPHGAANGAHRGKPRRVAIRAGRAAATRRDAGRHAASAAAFDRRAALSATI